MGLARKAPHRTRTAHAAAPATSPLPVPVPVSVPVSVQVGVPLPVAVRAVSAPVAEVLTVLGTAEIGGRTGQLDRSGRAGTDDRDTSVETRLLEDTWGRFMTDSALLAAAHYRQPERRSGQSARRSGPTALPSRSRRESALDREAGPALLMWIRLARWLFALIGAFTAGIGPDTSTAPAAAHDRTTGPETAPAPGRATETGPVTVPQSRTGTDTAGPDRTRPVPGPDRANRSAAMARPIAGAQRARSGVPSWA